MAALTPQGAVIPLITPFRGGQVDLETLVFLASRLIDRGVDSLFVLGTTGEFPLLHEEERRQVVTTVVQASAGRVPVYANVGLASTAETLEFGAWAREAGAAMLVVVAPVYFRYSHEALLRHYEALRPLSAPIIAYNIPVHTTPLGLDTVAALSRLPHVVGLKDSSSDLVFLLRCREVVEEGFALLVGDDSLIAAALTQGMQGCVSGLGNLVPQLVVQLTRASVGGRINEARELQRRLVRLQMLLARGPSFIAGIKAGLRLLGIESGDPRPPLLPFPESLLLPLRKMLDEMQGLR